MATCNQTYYAKDQDGNSLPFTIGFDFYRNGDFYGYLEIDSGRRLSIMHGEGSTYKIVAKTNVEGWTKPEPFEFIACSTKTIVYKKIETCTQSFEVSTNSSGLKFTPQVFIYIGYVEQPWTLVGVWDLPANIEDLTIGTVYTARPIIPSTYQEGDITAPEAVTFTACTETINFPFNLTEEDKNGGVYTVLIPVASSNLKAVGWIMYELNHPLLEVEFLSGSLYLYEFVPATIFDGLMNAASKGGYFWEHIRCKTTDCSGGNIPYQYVKLR